MQPLADAVKLFIKEQTFLSRLNYLVYFISPCFNILLSLLCWGVFPFVFYVVEFNFSLLFFMCCTALRVYRLLGAGWSSNSKYSLIGALRRVAQTISYEVRLAFLLVMLVVLRGSFCLRIFLEVQEGV